MTEQERLERRIAAACGEVSPEVLSLLILMGGPMLQGLDELVANDRGDVEPFDPPRALMAAAKSRPGPTA